MRKSMLPRALLPATWHGAVLLWAVLLCGPLFDTSVYGQTCEKKNRLLAGLAAAKARLCGDCGDCCQRPCWCPDDYVPKRMPCVCPPKYCGRCDDYCPKSEPCIRPPCYCGCCDDYCPKREPCLKIPCFFPSFYKCPPPAGCCSAKSACCAGKGAGRLVQPLGMQP
jgi:hypothetical protein